jgi:uncharacterized membrane protein YfcA
VAWAGPRFWTFAGIGLASGFFSALFGVGGGTIVVPLLILLAGFSASEATATSLAAIVLTALFGVVAYGALGEIDWDSAALVGFPAMVGTFGGTWLQRRVPARSLSLLFSAILVAVAVRLFFE